MSYLGNTPTTQSFISGTDYFNGTGAQTAFTLTRTVASVNDIQAVVNNVVQVPNDAYTISGTTITFTSAPSAGTNNVYVRYLSTTTQAITPSQNTVSWSTLDSNVQGDLGISFKNRIINSNMVIDQRNAGASVTPVNAEYTLDRYQSIASQTGKYSVEQTITGVAAPTGFTDYLAVTSLSSYSVLTGDVFNFRQSIEGYNIADLGWGTANAKTVTLSFWVRSSLTGTFGGSLRNSATDRSYPYTYTISSANTWEQKSVTIPGDTSGTWLTTNGIGVQVIFNLGAGSTFSGTAGAWAAGNFTSATGATSVVGTNGATFYITGVQFEVGTQATTFTTAGGSYGAELMLCQRYFQAWFNGTAAGALPFWGTTGGGTTGIEGGFVLFQQMRTAPTCSINALEVYDGGASTYVVTALINFSNSNQCPRLIFSASGLTANRMYYVLASNSTAYFFASAEL
jgi:hypothetical protein